MRRIRKKEKRKRKENKKKEKRKRKENLRTQLSAWSPPVGVAC